MFFYAETTDKIEGIYAIAEVVRAEPSAEGVLVTFRDGAKRDFKTYDIDGFADVALGEGTVRGR